MSGTVLRNLRPLRDQMALVRNAFKAYNFPLVAFAAQAADSPGLRLMHQLVNSPQARVFQQLQNLPSVRLAESVLRSPRFLPLENQVALTRAIEGLRSVQAASLPIVGMLEQSQVAALTKWRLPVFAWQSDVYSINRACATLEPGRNRDDLAAQASYIHEEGQDVASEVEDAIRRVDPSLVDLRRGAWSVFRSESPDRFRQTAHSSREFLRLLLGKLAPNERFTAADIQAHGHEGKVTRRMRVLRIMGTADHQSEGEFLAQIVNSVEPTYQFLSDLAHTGKPLDESLRAALYAQDAIAVALAKRAKP